MVCAVVCADVQEWAAEYDGPPFHALFCDAPYEMAFMGRDWDESGVSFDPATWAALAHHLLPGAFLFVFAGTVNDDLISVAIRRAGLRKHHKAIVWVQGQGFPKSARIDTQLDKAAGKLGEREVIGTWQPTGTARPAKGKKGHHAKMTTAAVGEIEYEDVILDITAPATPLAATWAGHRYGLQALKPCAETVLIFQKPYEGKPVECIAATGAGALNIDGGRVVGAQGNGVWGSSQAGSSPGIRGTLGEGWDSAYRTQHNPQGRWPPNVALCHHPACTRLDGARRVKGAGWNKTHRKGGIPATNMVFNDGFGGLNDEGNRPGNPDGTEPVARYACAAVCPGCGTVWATEALGPCPDCGTAGRWLCPVAALGEQSGELSVTGRPTPSTVRQPVASGGILSLSRNNRRNNQKFDTGTASRFYPNPDWAYEAIEDADAFHYCPKAHSRERNAGLADFYWQRDKDSPIGFTRISREEWEALPKKRRARGNIHPTQKPIALCKWLATLLLPPPEYAPRRLLVPFSGLGSEAVGSLLAGWEDIVTVELSPEYCEMQERRLDFWQHWAESGLDDPQEILEAAKRGAVTLPLGGIEG